MPPYCRGSKHQKNGLAPLEERKRLCDPPNLPNLISVICLFPINMQPLALFLRKEPGGLSSISAFPKGKASIGLTADISDRGAFPCRRPPGVEWARRTGGRVLPGGRIPGSAIETCPSPRCRPHRSGRWIPPPPRPPPAWSGCSGNGAPTTPRKGDAAGDRG